MRLTEVLPKTGREVCGRGSGKFNGQDMYIIKESQISRYVNVCAVRFISIGSGLQTSCQGYSNL